MQDDPNSPSRWFGYRIVADDDKTRANVNVSGRSFTASSQRYVAELMTDMLRGEFNVESIKDFDAIMLNTNDVGGIEVGQHRAAALAMLYGNENWQKIAKELGHKIKERQK
ncbi:hypothetical protein KC867_02730 [Candidatus Saccharibacteria bacterium]|nr:hypothetical protein [Candidatus Saccharibacteria bacterium]